MTVKALKKQLMAAIAMVLVATIALGSSTYAWFAANKTVTAESMSITATSDMPYLAISEAQDGTYDTDANAMVLSVDAATALKLVTPLNVASNVDYYANADDKAAGDGSETTPTKFTNAASVLWGTAMSTDPAEVQAATVPELVAGTGLDNGTIDDYVQSSELWFKVLAPDQEGTNLKVTAVDFGNTGSNSIAAAGRVLFVSESGKYMLYDCGTGTFSGDTALVATVNTTPVKVTVYFYFDGTDDDAYTNKATNIDDAVTAEFTFAIE